MLVRVGGLEVSVLKRWSPVVVAVVSLALLACSESKASDGGGIVISPVAPTATNGAPATSVPTSPPAATATSAAPDLHGFVYPIAGGCLPKGDQLMPNAPRPYRNGTHQGVDFYDSDNCTRITRGTEVLAAKAGKVVRADVDYKDLTAEEVRVLAANPNTEEALDKYRGRQVWIDHGNGVITRYAHLSGIAPGIVKGTSVKQGQVVAYVGESGTPESVSNPGNEYHLHFEVWVNGSYLGQGQAPAEVRRLFQGLFSGT